MMKSCVIAYSLVMVVLSSPGGVQDNLDPSVRLGDFATIKEHAEDILQEVGPTGQVINRGHGIEATTPEENAMYFVKIVRNS